MERSIADSIRKLAGTYGSDHIEYIWGIVDEGSVNLDNTDIGCPTCSVTGSQDVSYPNVALQATFCNGFLKVPSDGSQVVITKNRNSNNYFILLFSDLDAIYLQNQNAWLCIWNKNGEDSAYTQTSYGGLLKLLDPNNTDAGVLARLNKIETDINNLKTAFANWTPQPQDGGASLKGEASDWFGEKLVKTLRSDIEDAYITHGST